MRCRKYITKDRARSAVTHSDCDVALREEGEEEEKKTIITYRENISTVVMDRVVETLGQLFNFSSLVHKDVGLMETSVKIPIAEVLDALDV